MNKKEINALYQEYLMDFSNNLSFSEWINQHIPESPAKPVKTAEKTLSEIILKDEYRGRPMYSEKEVIAAMESYASQFTPSAELDKEIAELKGKQELLIAECVELTESKSNICIDSLNKSATIGRLTEALEYADKLILSRSWADVNESQRENFYQFGCLKERFNTLNP